MRCKLCGFKKEIVDQICHECAVSRYSKASHERDEALRNYAVLLSQVTDIADTIDQSLKITNNAPAIERIASQVAGLLQVLIAQKHALQAVD